MMEDVPLIPCPLCGHDVEAVVEDQGFEIFCETCQLNVYADGPIENLTKRWNRRVYFSTYSDKLSLPACPSCGKDALRIGDDTKWCRDCHISFRVGGW